MFHPHERLTALGPDGHQRIQAASVIVIGAGGLAHAAIPYLAAAGISQLVIVDGDFVEESNLHRQVLFTQQDLGSPKAVVTQRYLKSQFPALMVEAIVGFIGKDIGADQLPACDLIVDCSDNFSAALRAEEYAQAHHISMVYGKASRWDGQVTILNDWQGIRLRNIFSENIIHAPSPACSSIGVMAPVVGAVGCVMATEALKLLGGMRSELEGKLWTFDFLTCQCILVDMMRAPNRNEEVKDAPNFFEAEHTLYIDVREAAEIRETIPDSLNIPISLLAESLHLLPAERPIAFFCESRERARQAAAMAQFHGLENVRALHLCEIAEEKSTRSVS